MAHKAATASSSAGTRPEGNSLASGNDTLSPEEVTSSKKGTGLLKVPSRSSSQKNQSSPTSTGLSGATVSESRNSVSERSKDSKGSTTGRQRNGSTSSNRTGGDNGAPNTAGHTQPSAASAGAQRKKKGGLFSLLCCVSPDSSNSGDEETENVHKLEKLPQRPSSAKARPQPVQDTPTSQAVEDKATSQGTVASNARAHPTETSGNTDLITSVEGEDHSSVPPAVTVDPPKSPVHEASKTGKPASEDDVVMDDDAQQEDQSTQGPGAGSTGKTLPPPPPGPVPAPPPQVTDEVASSVGEPQKALLGPIRPEHQGRKCLVLDLDETLVHSSFKVRPLHCCPSS